MLLISRKGLIGVCCDDCMLHKKSNSLQSHKKQDGLVQPVKGFTAVGLGKERKRLSIDLLLQFKSFSSIGTYSCLHMLSTTYMIQAFHKVLHLDSNHLATSFRHLLQNRNTTDKKKPQITLKIINRDSNNKCRMRHLCLKQWYSLEIYRAAMITDSLRREATKFSDEKT